MKVEQIYTNCLAQGSYYIESNGEVAVIDPLREIEPYTSRAKKDNAAIKYIFETHFHADFVSGHLTLADETGAPIVYGPNANPSFDAVIAKDNQEFKVGNLTIVALHTPGHTMESTTYLLRDDNGKDHAIFSGDTLFLGDVGRPDLAQKAADITQEQLAETLYQSLRNKIMPLADDVIVYPAHGAGSACGKNMMKETVDTLGNQKKMNYALRADMTQHEFVDEVTDGLQPPPEYFPLNVTMNKQGYEDIRVVVERGNRALSVDVFEIAAQDALILDVRHQKEFIDGHIPGSVFIGLNGTFAPWVGALIADVQQPILLVTPAGKEEEAVTRLSRVGFDNTRGYLQGGIEAWKSAGKTCDTVTSVSAETFRKALEDQSTLVVDVRKDGEFEAEHVERAQSTPLDFLNDRFGDIPTENFYVYCAGGYRSVIAASLLKRQGIHNLVDVAGGYQAIKKAGVAVTDPVCTLS